jgi:mevalonate kinase
MLLGEHAVVYNHPCLVTAVGQRMMLTAELLDESIFELEAKDVNIVGYKKPMEEIGKGEIPKGASFIEIALKNFIGKYHFKKGIRITTKSEFSSKFGFGSSSASTVCAIKALSELTGKKLSNKKIFDLAYKTVLDIQKKGSGVDVAAAVYGGTLYFITAGKVIEPLKIDSLPLIVGYSGIKADTVTLINQVTEKAKKYPEIIRNIYNQIEILVEKAKTAIVGRDWLTTGELMNFNQGYLAAIGVSTQRLADMIYAARTAGAFGAKLSGAGGGDCMIAIGPQEKRSKVAREIKEAGGEVIDIKTNVEGVRLEK